MDVPAKKQGQPSEGVELLEEVASLTGLPPEWVQNELGQILENNGTPSEAVTLDGLRAAMLQYLEQMQAELAEQEAADLEALEAMAVPTSTSH